MTTKNLTELQERVARLAAALPGFSKVELTGLVLIAVARAVKRREISLLESGKIELIVNLGFPIDLEMLLRLFNGKQFV
jgi:hypothetical protein